MRRPRRRFEFVEIHKDQETREMCFCTQSPEKEMGEDALLREVSPENRAAESIMMDPQKLFFFRTEGISQTVLN